jgi:hypothetical protein
MLKRLLVVLVAVVGLTLAACSSCGGCGGGGGGCFHPCESPCYGRSFCRATRQMTDFVDVYFLNYDRHNPYRCDPCLGD